MRELIVTCPECHEPCGVHLEEGDLRENSTTEGFEWTCLKCLSDFSFDVYVDVMNKEKAL